MVLRPLEFVDCLLDSPYFRENLHNHEREVESTSKAIKLIVQQCKHLIDRTRDLSKAHRLFATTLSNFQTHFSVLDSDQTDDEADLESSLKEISTLLIQIEDEREQMLTQLEESFIKPMDRFRKTEIGNAKEEKKKFDKQTTKYCTSLERYLGAKAKSLGDDKLLEETTDAQLRQDYTAFIMSSMNYVKIVQEVQERKKFIVADSMQTEYSAYRECAMSYTQQLQLVQLSKRVEILEALLRFMNQQMVFYHLGYEIFENFKPYTSSLQSKIQKLRAAFESTTSEAENLKRKMLLNPKEYMRTSQYKGSMLTGYLLVMKKQKTVLNAVWSKHFCEYSKDSRVFKMVQYSQSSGMPKMLSNMEPFHLKSCVRLGAEVYDRRFCFTVMLDDQQQKQVQLVLQAPDENELRLWLDAMEGKEPIEQAISVMSAAHGTYKLGKDGYRFIQQCIQAVESRGLTEAGLYRVVGLTSKVDKLLASGMERGGEVALELADPEIDLKVITSAIKQYFRRLDEPLMTFTLHSSLVQAAKQDTLQKRASSVHSLVHRLPEPNFFMLKLLMQHLYKVACHSSQNLMTVSNLGVCFGPTLLRQQEETMAAIMDIKFCNVVVEIMIEHYHQIFETAPTTASSIDQMRLTSAVNKPHADDVLAVTAAGNAALASRNQGPPRPHQPSSLENVSGGKFFPSLKPGDFREMPIECDALLAKSSEQPNPSKRDTSYKPAPPTLPPPAQLTSSSSKIMRDSSEVLPILGGKSEPKSFLQAALAVPFQATSLPATEASGRVHSSSISSTAQEQGGSPELRQRTNSNPAPPDQSSPFANRRQGNPIPRMGHRGRQLPQAPSSAGPRKARALYECEADTEGELSFKAGDIIENIRESAEDGWLEGTVHGRTGLVPANFVVLL